MAAGQLGCERGELIFDWLQRYVRSNREKIIARLSRNVEAQPNGCVYWTGARNNKGYGKLNIKHPATGDHVQLYAHHVFFVLGKARPVTRGMQVDHRCWNRQCVNPDHLEEVTNAVNQQRKRRST
jgi:hypothetical protein